MTEKIVSDNFNVYDIFVRFGPGSILMGCLYYSYIVFFPKVMAMNLYVKIVLYISLSFIVGCLIKVVAFPLSKKINKYYFGGDPRNVFPYYYKRKHRVLKEKVTRRLAIRIIRILKEHLHLKNDYSKNELNHFAFGYMINDLEIKGYIAKSQGVNSLADMCSAFAATIILCDLFILSSYILQLIAGNNPGFELIPTLVIILISVMGFISSCSIYRYFTQMRFSIVIKQFAISNEWVKEKL